MLSNRNRKIISLDHSFQKKAAELCTRAYRDDKAVTVFFKGVDKTIQDKLLTDYWNILIDSTIQNGTVLGIFEDGELAGIKLFYTHKQYPISFSSQVYAFLKIAIKLVPTVGFARFFGYLKTVFYLEKKHPKKPHFYSELTCVDPRFQKRGLYTDLKKHMIHLAHASKVGIYGETSSATSARIIQRFGFKITSEEDIYGTHYWFLWKEPKLH